MKIVLKGNPKSTQSIYKAAHKRVTIMYMTHEGKALKEDYQWQAKSQYKGPMLTKELDIDIKLYFKDKRVRDWDNYHKLSMDALTGIVWKDDSLIQRATVEKFIDKTNPRIEMIIEWWTLMRR
jgi:Holliday junction resolvase RusA-like endonuclease